MLVAPLSVSVHGTWQHSSSSHTPSEHTWSSSESFACCPTGHWLVPLASPSPRQPEDQHRADGGGGDGGGGDGGGGDGGGGDGDGGGGDGGSSEGGGEGGCGGEVEEVPTVIDSTVMPSAAEAAAAVPRVEESVVCTWVEVLEAGTAMVAVMITEAAVTAMVTAEASTPAADAIDVWSEEVSS